MTTIPWENLYHGNLRNATLGEDYLNDLYERSKIDYLIRQASKFGYMLMPCAVIEK